MLTYEEIMKYCSDYKIEKGIVIEKSSNQQITDEDIILKVKSSVLLMREARESYQFDISQFGKTPKTQEDYIRKTMEKFGVSNEVSTFGVNKLVRAILSSDGHYEEYTSGSDLQNSKFSILVEPKREFGLAYLRLKFREKGLDISDLNVSQDLTELKKNGVVKVIIDFRVKRYEKNTQYSETLDSSNFFRHPRATELNDLERQKQIARQNKDRAAYDSAQAAIEKIVRESRAEVSPEEWASMSLPQKISFVQVKINEAKILHDEDDDLNYWNSNLEYLKAKLNEESKSQESSKMSNGNSSSQVDDLAFDGKSQYHETAQQTEGKKDYRFYFDEMMRAVKNYNLGQTMSEEQMKKMNGEIFYNEGCMINSLSNDEEIRQLMTLVVHELTGNGMQARLSNIILAELQTRYQQLHPDLKKAEENELDLSVLIGQLSNELYKVQEANNGMLLDGYIDAEALSMLINRINKAINDGYSLKSLATNQNDITQISAIIGALEEEQKKMNKMQSGMSMK